MKLQLNNEWRLGDSEIDLFKKMSQILSRSYNTLFIEETHQHYIHYHSPTVDQTACREISDLWIIAYSPSEKRIRMTFLQAKYHRKDIRPTRVFHGDYFQYELLANRPQLIDGGRFRFPLNILRFGCCDSLGSYGIFYVDNNKRIDMAYCCAKMLTISDKPSSYGQFIVSLSFPPQTVNEDTGNCNCNICSELNYTFDIDVFTHYLLHLKIGSELFFKNTDILLFIKNLLQRTVNIQVITPLINLINDSFDSNPNLGDNLFKFDEGNPNILITDVDKKEDSKE